MSINQLEVQQTTLNREELLEKAKGIGLIAEKYASEAEKNAKLSEEVIEKIKEAQFHKLLRPKEYGGQDLDYFTFGEMIRTIAYHSVPAAWLSYFFVIHETWPAFLPKESRDLLFNQGGLMADVFAPVGKVTDDGEGYRLSGQWNFCSGVLWSDWIALGAVAKLKDRSEPEYSMYIVHKDDVKIINNWDTLGLRGTGSNGVLVDNVYIPPNRVFKMARVMAGEGLGEDNYDPDYQIANVPYMQFFLMGFQFIQIGGVERLLDIFQSKTENRIRIFNNGQNEKEAASSQRVLAEMKIQLSALKGLSNEYVEKLTYYQKNSMVTLEEEEREKLFATRGYVAKSAAEMALRVMLTLGGNSVFKTDPTEMFLRDLITVAVHPTHLYEDSLAAYGKSIFGFKGNPTW
ncbi:3-hydroxy-9,10-secoandrosta-1,3,5(10)-triene-9,17-dione monooxygenase [Planomicrobium stackebrandtii]|uniref:3-hydroxy-9,10-secoandrosta-1,3,5(10)-triene-9, 17-dione monooxygenase n=1 Tax=Planomicrobium stackebrandtii TaxID=253160 RepID=A0ABU0GV90_9BACL|nr:acyl-CoA dehydrogenase family protein [Planomicrobium stackebrandtii]MDQ0429269.1 3-hydroxy-9,10-secoandrosta-1,3,5(10)-triene-9,17-dione monooxygenase [Planomicrobium stackebrandtii]